MKTILLSALSRIYGVVSRVRNTLYSWGVLPTYNSRLPVVSVGNLTVGGSGKSPIAAYLAKGLLERGLNPAILLRGYKGKIKGPRLVRGSDSAIDVGDESLMHFDSFQSEVPIVVSRRRVNGVKLLEQTLSKGCVVLDDGFQHRRLQRDFNLLLVDCEQLMKNGPLESQDLLPAGRLREQPELGIKRADAVLFVRRGRSCAENLLPKTSCPSFTVYLKPRFFRNVATDEIRPLESFKNVEVAAITAIAQPNPFFNSLKNLGLNLDGTLSYPDHYLFHGDEFPETGKVVVTEKDAAKIKRLPTLTENIWALGLGVEFVGAEEESFWSLVQEKLGMQLSTYSNAVVAV